MAIALRRRGEHDFVVLERADDVGGTWRDNTYPGAACDVQSNLYSFSFAPNPDWPRSYSEQPEIQAYLQATRRPVRRPRALRLRRRRHLGPVGRRRPALAGPDDGRRVPRPGARLRRRAPSPTRPIPTSRPGHLRRHGHALRPLGRLARPGRRAGRRHRHRRLGHPGRAGHPADRRQRRGLPADAGLGGPPHRPPGEAADAAALPRRPGAAEGGPLRPVPVPRVPGHRHGQAPPLPQAGREAGPGAPAQAGPRPEAARGPDAGLHDRLQAHPDQQRLLPRRRGTQRRAGHRRHRRGAASTRSSTARGSSARPTRSCWPPAST